MSIIVPIYANNLCASIMANNTIKTPQGNSEHSLKGKTEKELVEGGIPQEMIDEWKKKYL